VKVLFYDAAEGELADYFNGKIIKEFIRLGHEVEIYRFSERERNLVASRHFQMYEELMDKANDTKYDLLFHNNFIIVPEYFLSELKSRPYFKPKIVFFFQFREINKSIARTKIFKELVSRSEVKYAVAIPMFIKNLIFPKNFQQEFCVLEADKDLFKKKIRIINNDYTEPLDSFRTFKNLSPHKPFTIGFFGRWTEVKGVDYLLESLKYLEKDIRLLVNMPNKNWFWATSAEREKFKRVKIDRNYYTIGKLYKFLEKIDLIICPHKKSYEYGDSALPAVAFCAKKPIIAPDFYFFNEIVKRDKVGILFEPENPVSLAMAINYAKHKYNEIVASANFSSSLKDYTDKEEYARVAVGD
jgi:glycosyltransferase involved in cell wall biosynthesis